MKMISRISVVMLIATAMLFGSAMVGCGGDKVGEDPDPTPQKNPRVENPDSTGGAMQPPEN